MQTKTLWVLLFASTLVASAARADDLLYPRRNVLLIRSDTVLSGIDVYRETIADVIAKIGKPNAVKTLRTVTEGTFTFTERGYEWEQEDCVLRIVTTESMDGNSSGIDSVYVRGTRPCGEIGTTGRGLKLGDTMSNARRVYGLRPYFGATVPQERHLTWISPGCSTDDRTRLQVDLDEAGKINGMRIDRSETFCF